jgi:hypothetical protein
MTSRRRAHPANRCAFASLSAVLVTVMLCGCSSERRVAAVGATVITENQVKQWATILGSTEGSASREAIRRQRGLAFLIRSAWMREEASRLSVRAAPKEVEEKLTLLAFTQSHGAKFEPPPHDKVLDQLLLARSTKPAEREWLMQLAVLEMNVEAAWLRQAAREIPDAAVASYYEAHKSRFVEPAVSELEVIGNFDEKKVLKAKREIEAGRPFLEVARNAGQDSEAPNGLQRLVRGAEEPPYEKHIFGARLHVLEGPFKQALTYIFEVLHAKPDRQLTLTEASAQIRRRLAPKRAESVLRQSFTSRRTATTTCAAGYVVEGCREYRQ